MSNQMENKKLPPGTAGEGGQFSQGLSALSKMLRIAFKLLTVIIIFMLAYFFTLGGLFIVDSTRESVIRLHFGKYTGKVYTEGWYWVFPYPVNTIISIPKTNQTIRSFTFMPANRRSLFQREGEGEPGAGAQPLQVGRDGYLITGDNSILHTEWELVYRVVQPDIYYSKCLTPSKVLAPDEVVKGSKGELLGTRGAITLLQNTLDECIIKETASWQIRDILYDKTTDYIQAVEARLKKRLNEMQIGIAVESLALPVKRPPALTIGAFDDAMSAGTQAATEIEAARGYAIEVENKARSDAENIKADADAYKKRIVAEVMADSKYFTSILKEYKKNPDAVMVSLYSTTLGDALAKVKDKFLIRVNPGSRQEVRIKLNPEPSVKKNEKKEGDK